MQNKLVIAGVILLFTFTLHAQNGNSYPIKGYFSISHPIFVSDKNGIIYNFDNNYSVSFPFGIHYLKTDKIGFSFEFSPSIKFQGASNKTTALSFQPGIIFRRPHAINLLTRMVFESSGRYGMNLVFNKTFYKNKDYSYWVSTPLQLRTGNSLPNSIGIGLQFGVTF